MLRLTRKFEAAVRNERNRALSHPEVERAVAQGLKRLIEVKATNGGERAPFHISLNELAVTEDRRSEWCLFGQ